MQRVWLLLVFPQLFEGSQHVCSGNRLTAGVYRRYRVKSEISAAFVFARQQQTPKIDYHGVIRKAAEERLPRLIQSKLAKLLAQ